jgi:hypothetical protein
MGATQEDATSIENEPGASHDGTELVAEEIREELGRLATHPVREIARIEHVAEDGESAATPMILVVAVAGVAAVLFLAFLGLAWLFTDLFG